MPSDACSRDCCQASLLATKHFTNSCRDAKTLVMATCNDTFLSHRSPTPSHPDWKRLEKVGTWLVIVFWKLLKTWLANGSSKKLSALNTKGPSDSFIPRSHSNSTNQLSHAQQAKQHGFHRQFDCVVHAHLDYCRQTWDFLVALFSPSLEFGNMKQKKSKHVQAPNVLLLLLFFWGFEVAGRKHGRWLIKPTWKVGTTLEIIEIIWIQNMNVKSYASVCELFTCPWIWTFLIYALKCSFINIVLDT